jgi:hypothetical protein
LGQRDFSLPMVQTRSAAGDQTTADDLISFLKAIPDSRYRRGVRFPQWFLLAGGSTGDPERLPQLP